MKLYYIVKNNQKIGPMTPEQLVYEGLSPNSLVWTEGMVQWANASNVPELMAIMARKAPVSSFAPPTPQPQYQQNPHQQNPHQQNPYQQNPYQQNPYQQNPYQQNPYQQNPYQKPSQPSMNIPTTTIFKFLLYAILAFTAIVGIIMFIDSFSFFNKHLKEAETFLNTSFTFFGILVLFTSLFIISLSVVIALRIVKNQPFGFISIFFFAITFLFALLDWIILGSWIIFILLFVAGILGIACTIFAVIPTNQLGTPNGYHALMVRTQADIALIAIYASFMVALLIVGATTDFLDKILDNFSQFKRELAEADRMAAEYGL